MTNTFEKRKEQFAAECKVINLRYEYEGYTGKERYAIISSLTEEEFDKKFGEVAKREYVPYLLLSPEQGDAITEYQNVEAKYRMRNLRYGHAFDINDGEFEEHHPELAVEDDIVEKIALRMDMEKIRNILSSLPEVQKIRLIKYFFYEKSCREIAKEEGVNHSAVAKSIAAGIEKIRKSF